jgi:hypothetical protein
MRQRLTKQEIRTLKSIESRLCRMADKMDENDCELHYGNGSVASQLNCSIAAIETILQEFQED